MLIGDRGVSYSITVPPAARSGTLTSWGNPVSLRASSMSRLVRRCCCMWPPCEPFRSNQTQYSVANQQTILNRHYFRIGQTAGGTRWRSWLRHCATSWKVAGAIPDGVIGIFHWHNPSGRTMALGSTQPLTEMSTRNISWEVKAVGV